MLPVIGPDAPGCPPADFSVIGGRLERYRDDILGFLIINVRREDFDRVQRYLGEHRLFWEAPDDVA